MTRRTRLCPPGATAAIFVEGGDEERLARALLGSAADAVFWMTFDGRDPERLRTRAEAAANDPGWPRIRNVAVVLDAEEDYADGMALASGVLRAVGREPTVASGGLEPDSTGLRGIFVLPDGGSKGSTESLLRSASAPTGQRCVDALFQCAPNPGRTVAQRDKAWIGAYLALVRGNPRIDQAWSAPPAFDAAHPAFAPLTAFLRAVVAETPTTR